MAHFRMKEPPPRLTKIMVNIIILRLQTPATVMQQNTDIMLVMKFLICTL